MRNQILHTLLVTLLACTAVAVQGQEIRYGLTFKSYEVEKEKRTGLDLTPEKPLSLPGVYSLSFDVKFHSGGRYPFGYIFHIIDREGNHIDFLLNDEKDTGTPKLTFTCLSEELGGKTFDGVKLAFDAWTHISVRIDTRRRLFTAAPGGKEFTGELPPHCRFDEVKILFGKSNYPTLQVTDIPSMSLRDIRITDGKGKALYHWPLMKYAADGVYDEIEGRFAACENPEWMINQHVFWQKQISFQTRLKPQITYNPDKNEIAAYDQYHFFRYDLGSGKLQKDTVRNESPYEAQSNNLLYNHLSREYIYYHLELENEREVWTYDTLKHAWSHTPAAHYLPDFWHHNRFISGSDSNLYLLGGYGHHKYKDDLRIYDFRTGAWSRTRLQGDAIPPHYLSGLGKSDDRHVLLFGGYGNLSGSQELSPRFYYDLYEIDTRTRRSRKRWSLPQPPENFVVANTIVVDTAAHAFYALAFPTRQFHTSLSLLKFSTDQPEYAESGESIPAHFQDNLSFIDLYHAKASGQLVAVISSPAGSVDDSVNTVSFHTLTYPPLSKDDLYQTEKNRSAGIVLPAAAALLILLTAGAFAFYRHSGKAHPPAESKAAGEAPHRRAAMPPPGGGAETGSVCLLGGFRVTGKDGSDITKEFTPMLKQLFILILLYTCKDPEGISSARLNDILWFDKSGESAKNNRGVSMRRLRRILQPIGQIRIISNNSRWTVEWEEDISCDYAQALLLVRRADESGPLSIDCLKRLLSVVSAGSLLPDIQTEWIDPFKAGFSDRLVDLLLKTARQPEITADAQLRIDLADTLLIYDSLNEDALRMKCTALVGLGRNGLARDAYHAFAKEYQLLFGARFGYTFEQIITPECDDKPFRT
jgi:DNA-binding SARP family transcriptional activator